MIESLAGLVRMPGVKGCRDEGQYVRWRRKEKSVDMVVSKSGDYSREEVCDTCTGSDSKQDGQENVCLGILESEHEAMEEAVLLILGFSFANICAKAVDRQLAFLFIEPSGRVWEVWKDKVSDASDHDSGASLKDEHPTPCAQTSNVVHAFRYSSSDESGKCSRNQRSRIQQGSPQGEFFSGVPA